MSSLKSLNIVPLPKSGGNPTLDRRARVIARLEEQKLLLSDSSYMRSIRSWSKGDDGKKVPVQTKQRVLPWWSAQPNGSPAAQWAGWASRSQCCASWFR